MQAPLTGLDGALCLFVCALGPPPVVAILLRPPVISVWLLGSLVTQALDLGPARACSPDCRAQPWRDVCVFFADALVFQL